MDVSVLYTFIDKFKYLWQSGQDANLSIDTRAGQAWAQLDIHLGHDGPLLHHQHQAHPRLHGDSPTRRREWRAQACQANAAVFVGVCMVCPKFSRLIIGQI